jgi:hypothetical protein
MRLRNPQAAESDLRCAAAFPTAAKSIGEARPLHKKKKMTM